MTLSSLKSSPIARRLVLVVMVLVAVSFVVGPMLGRQQGGQEAVSPEQQEQLTRLHEEAAGLRQKLGVAQQAALQKNPTLAGKQRELLGLIDSKLKAEGLDPAQLERSLKQLRARTEDSKLGEGERQKAATEAMALLRKLEAARHKVLAEPGVASQLQSFRGELLSAMQKEDPSIARVIQQLEETEAQLEALQPPT